MKNAIIIHGCPDKEEFFDSSTPSPSNNQWLPWLQKQLGMKEWSAQTPEMPDAYEPNYETWKKVFEQYDLDEETVLVGHSCGGGFLIRWLSEHEVKIEKMILVAPWLDLDKEFKNDFFDFEIDLNLIKKTTEGITLFYSTDDDRVIIESVDIIKSI